jgi:hypothetical protein
LIEVLVADVGLLLHAGFGTPLICKIVMIIDCVRAHLAPGTSANVRSTEEISAPSVSIENRVVRVWTKPRDIRLSVFAWEGGILESNISLSRCRESVCLWGRCHRMPQDARRKTQDARRKTQDARRKTQDARRKTQDARRMYVTALVQY